MEVGDHTNMTVEVCFTEATDSCPDQPDATAKAFGREQLLHR